MQINSDLIVSDIKLPLLDAFNTDIVEYNHNDYGYWIKFKNGVMIVWDRVWVDVTITKTFGSSTTNYGYVAAGWTKFPQSFSRHPITIFSPPQSTTNVWGIQPYSERFLNQPPGFYPLTSGATDLSGKHSFSIAVAYITIGRWREYQDGDENTL